MVTANGKDQSIPGDDAAAEPEATRPAAEPEATPPAPEPEATPPAPEPEATRPAPEPEATPPAPEPEATPPAEGKGDADDERLAMVGERIDEAKRAADEVADQLNVTDDERRVAAEDAAEPQGGTDLTPG